VLDEETLELLKDTVDDTADENGWAFLGEIGSLFNKRKPDFDARNYGYDKMSHLFKAYAEDFEIEERNTDKSRIKHYYIRNIIKRPLSAVAPSPKAEDKKTVATTDAKAQEVTAKPTNQNARKKGRQNKKPQETAVTENPPKELAAVQQKEEQQAVENIAQNDSPNHMLFPAAGNKITADDTKKAQIRITKDFKPLFPTKSQKLRIVIDSNEYECNFTYRGRGFHVLKLGKEAATQLGLAEGIQLEITKLNEHTYTLQNQSR